MILDSQKALDYFWKNDCLRGQFRFFTSLDRYLLPSTGVKFFVVEEKNLTVCLAHLSYDYDFSKKTLSHKYNNPWKITFISTRIGEENKGYASKIISEIFTWAKESSATLIACEYSQEGFNLLKPILIRESLDKKVNFLDTKKVI